MADNKENDQSREDLSDEPSQHRIDEFRKKGQVVQSRELASLLALLAAAGVLYFSSPKMGVEYSAFLKEVLQGDFTSHFDLSSGDSLEQLLWKTLKVGGLLLFPVAFAGFVFGIIGSFAQVGSIFSTDPITPDFEKINPIKGIQRFFSMKRFYDSLRIIFKFCFLIFITYTVIKSQLFDLPGIAWIDPRLQGGFLASLGKQIFLALVGVLLVFAGIDFWLERWEFSKQTRLTKQEAKQEHKEREGDPQIKARIRAVQREVARRRMMEAVKKADVIVTNPTHIAVALVYDREKGSAPRVVAKGADLLAQKIKEIAKNANVPMVENVPLARALFKSVKIGKQIPRALYQAVAEVLAYVYRLKGKTGGGS